MFPTKKPHAWRDHVKTGAPAPGAEHTPGQHQKGTDSNAAPPNKGGGMPVSKPSSGRSVSMPKHSAMKRGKEAPPASNGGKVGPSRAGVSAQPITASVTPDVSGGQPSGMGSGQGYEQPPMPLTALPAPSAMMGEQQPMMPGMMPGMLPGAQPPMAGGQPQNPIAELIKRMLLASGKLGV